MRKRLHTLWVVGLALVAGGALASAALADAKAFDAQMQNVLEPYLKVQQALSSDTTEGVEKHAKAIRKAAKKLDEKSVTGEHAEHFKDVPRKLVAAASKLAKSEDLEQARAAFKKLSRPMAMWASMSKPKGVYVVFCSMAKGSWLQKSKEIRNPYHGAKMLTCGEIVGGDSK